MCRLHIGGRARARHIRGRFDGGRRLAKQMPIITFIMAVDSRAPDANVAAGDSRHCRWPTADPAQSDGGACAHSDAIRSNMRRIVIVRRASASRPNQSIASVATRSSQSASWLGQRRPQRLAPAATRLGRLATHARCVRCQLGRSDSSRGSSARLTSLRFFRSFVIIHVSLCATSRAHVAASWPN